MHEIAMLIYSKSVSCICPSKVAEDSAQAPEEEPSVVEVPNSTNDSSSLWSALTHNGTGQARRLFPPPSAGQNVIRARPSARLDEECAPSSLQSFKRAGELDEEKEDERRRTTTERRPLLSRNITADQRPAIN
jgi:hypothetical protein